MPGHRRIVGGARFPRLKAALLFVGVGGGILGDAHAHGHYQSGRDEMRDRVVNINNAAVSMEILSARAHIKGSFIYNDLFLRSSLQSNPDH